MAAALRLEIQRVAGGEIRPRDFRRPVGCRQWQLQRAGRGRIDDDISVAPMHQAGNAAEIAAIFQRVNQREHARFAFAGDAVIRAGQRQQFFRKNAEAAAAKNHRRRAVLPDGGGERREFVVEFFPLADQHVVNVAQRNADEVRLKFLQRFHQLVQIGKPVQPARLVAGAAQRGVDVRQPQRKHRVGCRATVGADEQDAAGHEIKLCCR